MDGQPTARGTGRPRSQAAHKAILDAAQELLISEGYDGLRLEHVAAKAGVGKATLYRRWSSKAELAEALLEEHAIPAITMPETDDTRTALLEVVMDTITALTETSFGPVIRALMSQIAINPQIGDPFRATVKQARRRQVAAVIERGIDRGDLHRTSHADTVAEILVGPIYYRLIFGGPLDRQFAEDIVSTFLEGHSDASAEHNQGT